jgi:hypothetical protein
MVMTRLFILGSILFSTIFWQSPVKANEQLLEKLSRKVTVQVSIQDALIPKDVDEWVLYVYASQPGTRLPLANFKGRLSDLPREVVLHQSMYLLPHLTLQQAESVVIIAKASKSKNPHQKSSQDIIGYSTAVSFKSGPEQMVSMIIDQHDKTVLPK